MEVDEGVEVVPVSKGRSEIGFPLFLALDAINDLIWVRKGDWIDSLVMLHEELG